MRQAKGPTIFPFTGTGDIDETVYPGRPWRLVALRCHFAENPEAESPSSDPAVLTVSQDAELGEEYDCDLYKFTKDDGVGIGADAQMVVTASEDESVSPWVFKANDGLRVRWTNPGGVRWGLQVGIAFLE